MIYDIIIVGAGPAGLTAGANAANRGLSTLILEGSEKPGGQPANLFPKKIIIDHPGFPKGVSGRVLSKKLYQQAFHSKAKIKLHEPMVDLDITGKIKKIVTRKRVFKGRKVIFCTGLHNIPKHMERLKDYKGKNVHYYIKKPKFFYNKKILLIGDGDTAFDRANMLARHTDITIAIRKSYAKAKKSSVVMAKKQGIKILSKTELVKLDGKEALLETKGKKFKIPVDEVIVSIGFVSSLDVLNKAGIMKTKKGMIKVNARMETSVSGVFAAGDIASDVKLIAVACSQGIIAAISTFDSIKKPYWLTKK